MIENWEVGRKKVNLDRWIENVRLDKYNGRYEKQTRYKELGGR